MTNKPNASMERLKEEFFNKFPIGAMTDMQRAYMHQIADHWVSVIPALLKEAEERTMKILDRHCEWKSTEGHGSDEERGYQKGLMAEARLIRKEIMESLTEPKG